MKMGIIAEDDSDVAVVREVTLSLLKPHRIGFRRFVGHGCGKLRRKCGAWARTLLRQGCPWITVVHDLDVHDERQLHAQLTEAIAPAGAKASVVLIPKREVEAWLLYDGAAIAAAFMENQQPRLPGNPESLLDPKEHLRDLIWRKYGKQYLNTVHNARIGKHIDVRLLSRSASFAPHPLFAATVRRMLR
ncbi:MAG: DUF4276 family protein [Acidobacteriia bacterium]|nr:DUF4276 family protein [Terriglobia bacterium]